jgi:putative membrane protein
MDTMISILIYMIICLQTAFMFIEMFLWNTATGRKLFRMDESYAKRSASLAANQGLYNGFLAAGLLWALLGTGGNDALVFFLSCIIIAGIYGAITATRTILWIQALPAAIALGLLLLNTENI